MMIAIPNMSKPKDCKECQWHLDFYIEDEQVGGLCTITEKDDKENTCPLIEIVECKDCKWFINEGSVTICDTHETYIEPTDFCSYGERRTDGDI